MTVLKKMRGLFVTGTDTDAGKTYCSALIAAQLRNSGYRVGVYKPAASGCELVKEQLVAGDAVALWEAAGRPLDLDAVCPQRFQAPLAPHLAARKEGREISSQLLISGLSVWEGQCDIVIVEGAGGLMSPICDDLLIADLAMEFGFPVVIVARNEIGVINQALQTSVAAACFRGGLAVAGIVVNDVAPAGDDPSLESNRDQIASWSQIPVLTRLRHGAGAFDDPVDWYSISNPCE